MITSYPPYFRCDTFTNNLKEKSFTKICKDNFIHQSKQLRTAKHCGLVHSWQFCKSNCFVSAGFPSLANTEKRAWDGVQLASTALGRTWCVVVAPNLITLSRSSGAKGVARGNDCRSYPRTILGM